MYIYKTKNLVNGKIYIGQHCGTKPSYLGSGKLLKTAIKKYGRENFKREILEYCDNFDHMNEREIIWIARYDSTNPLIGYNLEYGGNGKGKVNEETKKKLSKAHKGKKRSEEHSRKIAQANKGKKHSEETKRKLSEISLNMSEETKKKMSEAQKGRKVSEEHRKKIYEAFKGKKHSEETKRKLSEANKGKKMSKESIKKISESRKIKVIQLTLDGLKVKIWDSATDAENFGFRRACISSCCRGEGKTSKGFKWMYLHDYEKGLNND